MIASQAKEMFGICVSDDKIRSLRLKLDIYPCPKGGSRAGAGRPVGTIKHAPAPPLPPCRRGENCIHCSDPCVPRSHGGNGHKLKISDEGLLEWAPDAFGLRDDVRDPKKHQLPIWDGERRKWRRFESYKAPGLKSFTIQPIAG
ncbi:MAG: hypothetical protein ABSA18_05990 [Dehalococcoidia bacterium]